MCLSIRIVCSRQLRFAGTAVGPHALLCISGRAGCDSRHKRRGAGSLYFAIGRRIFGESRRRFFREFLGLPCQGCSKTAWLESEESWECCGRERPCGLEPSNVR